MELRISTKNFESTDTLKKYIQKKWLKLKRFFPVIIDASMVLEKDKPFAIIELTLSVKHSFINSKIKNPDIYLGINEVFKKIERQLVRYEAKYKERKRIAQKQRIR